VGGLLRLRTPPELRVVRGYGHLFPDDQYDNLYHVISADPQDSFAFDFEYANAEGLEGHAAGSAVTLQMVFQYTIMLPAPAGDAATQAEDGSACRCCSLL
jgi:hypothetical protein